MLWASMQVAYSMEEALDITEDSLIEFMLETVVLPLGVHIWMFSETALDLRELDIAEIEEIMFVFIISLLGATIQDDGMKERSDICNVMPTPTLSSK